ncbi:uncharacterized protein N7484_008143 [Penicillium longicatenatum]|uniref:uncharacterized protein n=1 Tax=Penicillium longicatenatum TaxID=1561947 RepID=UPI00254993A7|nr:uncharacterized protein N7484_008143 [Penicillium longicatenatum]KAJ5640281.1 hypothetical protein N7484_008143 [Penicillium longicatenatum]
MNAAIGDGPYHSPSQISLIDVLFPGFSIISASAQQLLAGNLDSYTGLLCTLEMLVLFARYISRYVWDLSEASTIYVSYYDEAYDMLLIADQLFIHNAHSSIARVRLTQRTNNLYLIEKKPLTFSPWNGSFLFWYKGHLLVLHCAVKEHRENLHISSIGLNANILKSLIEECREKYLKGT